MIYDRVINGNTLVFFVTKPNTFIVKQTWQFNPNSTGGTEITRTLSDLKLLSPDAPDMTKIIPTVVAKENKLMQEHIIADMPSENEYIFHYFSFAGRGEGIRLLLNHAGVQFEDRRIQLKEWNSGEASEGLKNQFPNRQVPCLELPDGRKYGQGNAILRFLGKKHGYYPTDPMEAFRCEEYIDVYRDLVNRIQSWYPMFQKDHDKMNADLLD
jgi:hypothetical protein